MDPGVSATRFNVSEPERHAGAGRDRRHGGQRRDPAALRVSSPRLVTTVFADQPISTMLGDNRENAVLKTQTPPVEKGFGYGGGFLEGAAGTRVRSEFLPTAYTA